MKPATLAAGVVFAVVVFMANIGGGLAAVKCYECNSVAHSGCQETFDANGITEAPSCNACRKTVSEAAGIKSVTRSCDTSCTTGGGGAFGINAHTYCCSDKDLCNAAVKVNVGGPLATLLAVMVALVARLL